MIKRLLLQSLFLGLLFSFAHAQTYPFANYSVKDGLAQSNVSGIIQDSSGYFWLATESGVSRFDGRNFVNYTTEDGLADNNVSAIFLDRSNRIWLGHENGSVTVYDGKTFSPIHSKAFPKDKKIYGFFQERSGSLWVCTATGGAIKIMDPSKVGNARSHIRVYSAKDGLSQYVFAATQDQQNTLWFLTDVGIKFMNPANRQFEFFRPEGMPPGQVTSLAQDRKGHLLIGTSSGAISRYNPKSREFQVIVSPVQLGTMNQGGGPSFIYTMLEDSKGSIWASVFNYGVCRYEPANNKVTVFNTANGLGANKIKSITEDREGNILFGTLGEGMEVFAGERLISFTKNDGLADAHVWAVCQDRGGFFWFGTNEGLTVYDPRQSGPAAFKNLGYAEGLTSLNIRAIVADRNGDLWIGTWGGKVLRYSIRGGQIAPVPALNELVNPYVSCLMVDTRNNLWVGTIEGVVKYEINSGVVKTMRTINGLIDNDVTAFCEDSQGQIWIGTKQKGISVFDGKNYKKLNRENGLMNGSITSLAEDGQKRLWIGTEGGGVFIYDKGKFSNYKIRDGLLSDFITLLITDRNNNLWLGTNKGLNKYDAGTGTFKSYTASDGFTGLETKARATCRDNEGNLWFGTVNGVFRYSPRHDVPVPLEPLIKLTRLRVNLQDHPVNGQLKLSYEQNSLHMDFVGISLSNPHGVTYKTKLEGYDKDFKPASNQNFEIFSNLPPGNYEFKLIACNSSGACSKEPFTMEIVITPPFWKTWWFYLGMLVLIVGLLLTYIKLRERKLQQEKKILEDKVSERTAEVVEKNMELDEKNKDITASIRYAKRIQDAILPPDEFVRRKLPNTFILFKPKDIVSGDFYWIADKGEYVIFTAVDCTGHGVPGAFMSIVGHNLLDRIVVEQNILKPSQILDELNKSVSETLRQSDHEDNAVRDGMDIALCVFNRTTQVLQYAGAYNPLWLVRNGELTEIKADKFPIGNLRAGETRRFTNHEIQLLKGDTAYVFSDGYADQFGGPAGKKFKASSFKQLLLDSTAMNMEEQGRLLNQTIESWRGVLEQVDDILVIGTRL